LSVCYFRFIILLFFITKGILTGTLWKTSGKLSPSPQSSVQPYFNPLSAGCGVYTTWKRPKVKPHR